MNQKFYNKVREAIGGLYVWGGQGHVATEAYLRSRAKQYPQYFDGGRLEMMLRRIKESIKLFCWDCSGLVCWALVQLGLVGANFDTTADGLWRNYCTPITKAELRTGDLLFRKSGSKMVHVGIYAPGACVEAAGGAYGVVECKGLSGNEHTAKNYVDGKTYTLPNWTHYGRLKVLASTEATKPAPTPTAPADLSKLPILKRGSTGESVKALQRLLQGYGIFKGTIGGNFLDQTEAAVKTFQRQQGLEVDGKVGPQTRKALGLWI